MVKRLTKFSQVQKLSWGEDMLQGVTKWAAISDEALLIFGEAMRCRTSTL